MPCPWSERGGVWRDGSNPYPFPFPGGGRFHLPECRIARHGTRDAGSPQGMHARRYFDALVPLRSRGGRRRWTLVDSFGEPLAVLARQGRLWSVRDPVTGAEIYRGSYGPPPGQPRRGFEFRTRKFELQGRGCMVNDDLERRYALVVVDVDPNRTRVGGRRLSRRTSVTPLQLRAFVDRRALPRRNWRGQPIAGAVDRFYPGCGGSFLAEEEPLTVSSPRFSERRHYWLGTDGLPRTYAFYNAKANYFGARYFLISTTGVRFGGIARGVVRESHPVTVVDDFGYCDPNGWRRPAATWSFGRVAGTRMWGWFPRRCSQSGSEPPPYA